MDAPSNYQSTSMRVYRPWLPVVSALLFQLSFPSVNLRLLVFVCLVPWFLYLRGCSRKQAFRSGYLFGFLIILGQLTWLFELASRWTGSAWLGVIPWLLGTFLCAFYFAFLGVLLRGALLRKWYWAAPLLWSGVEVIRSFFPGLAFPYYFLATPLTPYPALDQMAFFATIYFVSGWVCLVNVLGLLLMDFARPSKRQIPGLVRSLKLYGIAAVLLAVLSGVWYLRPERGEIRKFSVGQPGFDLAFGDQNRRAPELAERVDRIYGAARESGSSLIILPEGVTQGGYYPPQPPFDLKESPPILFGGQRGEQPAYQTAFLYDHGHWSYADKSRLVVFGEYVPGRDYLPFLKSFKLSGGDLTASDKVTALQVGDLTIGPMLCFEGLFWDIAHKQAENGSQVLAVMAIDDWYVGTPAPEQLAEAAPWRAIETGLPVLRSASMGYTTATDGRGRVLGKLPFGACAALNVSLPIEAHPLRNPLRPAFPWLVGLFPFGFAVFLVVRKRK